MISIDYITRTIVYSYEKEPKRRERGKERVEERRMRTTATIITTTTTMTTTTTIARTIMRQDPLEPFFITTRDST